MMYGIRELTGNYTMEELAAGGVLALSEVVPINKRKVGTKEEPELELTSDFQPEEGRRNGLIRAKVRLDEVHGELISSECNCMHFLDDSYACVHTVALQMAWILKQEGEDALRDSPLKDILCRKTGLPDPFIPGILRRTSGGLQQMMKSAQKTLLPVGKGKSSVTPGSLRLELYMDNTREGMFELKVGERRAYVVKDLYDFLKAFQKHTELGFGKSFSFPAYEELFDGESRRLLIFLLGIFRLNERDRYTSYFYSRGGNNARYVKIVGRYYDALMELMEGKEFYLEDGQKIVFSSERYKPWVKLDKLTYGASLEMEMISKIAETENWIYFRKGDRIYRVPYEEGGRMEEFRTLFAKQGELYISEQDLPVVCTEILADVGKSAELRCMGMELGDYLPEKPKLRFYLDLPQEDMVSARPVACYGDQEFPLGMKLAQKDRRDGRYEQEMLSKLLPLFHAYDEKAESYVFQGEEADIYYFMTEILPRLQELGELFISDQLKKLRVRPLSGLSVGVSIDGGLLELTMESESFTKEELMEILSAYRRKKKYYRLKNGAFIQMDEEQEVIWGALAECVRGLRRPTDGEWKLPLFRAVYLDEMLKDRDSVNVDRSREYRRLLGRMREAQNNAYEPPASLKDILRGYQEDGFRWIKTLKANGFGGILADDMGLGKTLQVLAFLLSEKEAGKKGDELRTLIITPASLIYNWKKEIEKYVPALSVRMIAGTAQERQQMIEDPEMDAEVWITSYDLLKRDIRWYETIVFANEILDEAQFVKNQTTHAAKSVRLVQAGFRMALTGTPIENRLSELWSIFDYLMPGFLYSYNRFRDEIESPVVGNGDKDVMERLRLMVHPFILRRLKKEVLKELPEKLEEEILVTLDGEQKRLYDAHVQRLRMYLEKQSKEEFAQGKLEILAELTKLRQLCCNPGMILEDYQGANVKLDACMELLHQAIEGGHKILLFSQFTTMLDAIGERLKEEKIACHRIDGSVKKEERMRLVEAFDEDDVPVFCISLKAGGTGLNLTAADIVIHFDPWWNLAAQNQATDRTHRIGQTHVVTVYQLIAEGTIEEKILNLQKSKYQLAEDVLSGEGISSIMIDQEQVLSLLDAR